MALSPGVSAVASHASSATTSAVTTTANSGIEIIVTATGTTAPTVSDAINGAATGNTWTQIGSRAEVASYPGSIWHFKNESGARGALHTFTAAAGDVSILVQEVLGDSPVVDVSTEGTDNGASPWDSPTLTPTAPDFLLVAGIGTNSAGSTETYTAGNSFTRQQQVQNGSLYWTCAVGTRVVTGGSGSYNSSWTAAYAPTSSGHTITAWKEASGGPSIGGHGLDYDTMGTSGSSVGTSSFTSAASGSIILAGVGRGVLSDHASATVDDNKGNGAYTQLGTAHGYWYWPTSGPAIFAKIGAAGGAGHIVSASKPTATDEVTVVAAEFRGVSRIVDYQWVEDLSSPNTSASVTVPGDAILCAFWWGDDATGNSGFTSINTGWTELDKTTSTGGNHVQVGSAYKVVGVGSHTVEWTPAVSQGAQLWIVAMDAGAAAPIIDRHPQAARVGAGDLATFTVAATTSGGSLSYQWKLNGVNVGSNQNSYSFAALDADNGKLVTVVATDSNGSTTSDAAVLTVVAAREQQRRKAARTTADWSAAGWFSEAMVPASLFDRDMLVMPASGGAANGSSSATLSLSGSAAATANVAASSSATITMTGVSTASGGAVTGSSSATVSLTGAATASAPATSASAATVVVVGTATATASVAGASAGTVTVTGTATAAAPEAGSSTGTIALAGTSTASALAVGASSGTIVLAGSAAGGARATGSSAGTVGLTASAVAVAPAAAASAATVVLAGSATATTGSSATAASAATIAIAGTATAAAPTLATSAGAVVMTGTAAALAPASASGAASIALAGTGTAQARATGASAASINLAGAAVAAVIARAYSAVSIEMAAQSAANGTPPDALTAGRRVATSARARSPIACSPPRPTIKGVLP